MKTSTLFMRLLRIEPPGRACQLDTKRIVLGALGFCPVVVFSDFRAFLWRALALVLGDSLGEGVAVDAEDGGRVGDVLFVAGERLLDVQLLEFAERFVEKD